MNKIKTKIHYPKFLLLIITFGIAYLIFSVKTFSVISYLLNTAGIFVILFIGISI